MDVKIDTKERFDVVRPQEPRLSANMAGELARILTLRREAGGGNLVLDMSNVQTIEAAVGSMLLTEQDTARRMQRSFVICCLSKRLEAELEAFGVQEGLNTAPTESEAWDILQMEEIERELLSGPDADDKD
jgi:anti-anti-sigma regulatory factor